jgi:KDO2-lipid IV(A) lauroyltransferase
MSAKTSILQLRFFLNPIYWLTWLGIGFLYLTTLLPYGWMLRLGTALGWLGYHLLPSRRRITRTNLRLVFPGYNEKQINQLTRESFYSTSIALFESAWAWWASDAKLKSLQRIEGLDNLHAAEKLGNGILLLGGHYTTLEMSGRLLAYHADNVYPTYKPARNPLFEAVMAHNRRKMNKGLVASRDMRQIIRLLKQKQIIWYAPDQDFGTEVSVFAPFMGVQTATLTMSTRLAKVSKAPVVPFYSERLPDKQGYVLRIEPMLENFPSGDDITDATAVNQAIEKHVRTVPAQYLWGHRRFKTRPHGEPQVYKPRRGRYLRRYTQVHCLLSLPIILYTVWIAIKNRQLRYLIERLTFASTTQSDLILHAASIGEINAAAPLINRILKQKPDTKVLITMNTPSGRKTAENLFGKQVSYRYMPVDWHWLTYAYLKRVNPDCSLIMETELWPNYFEYFFFKGIPNIIINGRLSKRTLNAPKIVKTWLIHVCEFVTFILARSQEDAERYISLGMRERYIKVLGNIKFSVKPVQEIKLPGLARPFVLVASSRDGEEKLIAKAWRSIDSKKPLLVIVPRHIHRLKDIEHDLRELSYKLAVRSRNEVINDETEIYIADTFGELTGFINESLFVIMGGSFEAFGGQNIIEVGQAGKAVIFGPHMDNFKLEAEQFVKANAAIQVEDQTELTATLSKLLDNKEKAAQLGNNGFALVEQYKQIDLQYLAEIEKWCTLVK